MGIYIYYSISVRIGGNMTEDKIELYHHLKSIDGRGIDAV